MNAYIILRGSERYFISHCGYIYGDLVWPYLAIFDLKWPWPCFKICSTPTKLTITRRMSYILSPFNHWFFYLHMILEICMHKKIWVAQNIPKGRTPILHISNLAIFFYLPIVLFIFCPFLTVWRYFWPIWPFMTPK